MPGGSSGDYERWAQEQAEGSVDKPVRSVVSGYIPDKELLKVELFGNAGPAEIAVRHPFLSPNAWIRVGPEAGASIITQRRGDIPQSEVWGYLSRNSGTLIKRAQTSSAVVYRVLQEGEVEVMSKGMASSWWSGGGDLELWGGTISEILCQTELEHRSNAPTFSRRLATNAWKTIGQEERFGLVKRPSKLYPEVQQDYVKTTDSGGNEVFACEYGRWLGDTAGNVLVVLQEGHVVDETGALKTQNSTNKNLRYEKTWKNNDGSLDQVLQIDEDLNLFYVNNNPNQIEAKLNWGTLCDVTTTANKFNLTLQDTGQFTTGTSLIFGASGAIQIGAPSVTIGSSTSAASGASEPGILGRTFVTQILVPLFTALITWFTTLSADPVAKLVLPVESVAAATVVTTLNTTLAQVNTALSQVFKMSS